MPEPYNGEPDARWPDDILSDYTRLTSDDDRRRFLLNVGYDKDHKSEALRLFPDLPHSNEPQKAHSSKSKKSTDEKSLYWTIAGVVIAAIGIAVSVVLAFLFR